MTEREQFSYVLSHGPIYRSDAIVVLMGEDALPRLGTAVDMLQQSVSDVPLVLTGALHEPPRLVGAEHGAAKALGLGVAPDRVLVEPRAKNTHEQAVEVLKLAVANEWKRLALVASPYHLPRAFLTFLREVERCGLYDGLHLVPVPAAACPWWQAPAGMQMRRVDLLPVEYEKIVLYRTQGHVASYADGLAYLRRWEKP